MRAHCDDPGLQGVLDYTIERYHRIGPLDVSVQYTVNFLPSYRALAYNCPWLPGVTLDRDLLDYPVEFGAVILCHEALHVATFLGHSHITARENKPLCFSRGQPMTKTTHRPGSGLGFLNRPPTRQDVIAAETSFE